MAMMETQILFSLNRDAKIVVAPDGASAVEIRGRSVAFPGLGTEAALRQLATTGASGEGLRACFSGLAGGGFYEHLAFVYQIEHSGVVDYSLSVDGAEIVRLVWLVGGLMLNPDAAKAGSRYRLSRFAYIHRQASRLILESPLGSARVELPHSSAAIALQVLSEGADAEGLAGRVPGFDLSVAKDMLTLLCNARAVAPVDEQTGALEEDVAPLAGWEFHDLLFHGRSRRGRHSNPYGGTFHRRGLDAPPPFLPPPPESSPIALPKPDMERLKANDPSFASTLENRRSIRDYADTPLNIGQLGEFLYRSARVQRVIETGADDMDYSFRPSPAGGAIHELLIYPVVGECDGLARGIYRYDPVGHALFPINAAAADVDRMLEMAWVTADRKSRPQVYFAITAYFGRLQWKYESIVYAVILKNVGALYQTMYLAATAMGLAPCALGGGDSDFFARTAHLDGYAETSVGEFVLGTRQG